MIEQVLSQNCVLMNEPKQTIHNVMEHSEAIHNLNWEMAKNWNIITDTNVSYN